MYGERAQRLLTARGALHAHLVGGHNLAEAWVATAAALHCISQVDDDMKACDAAIAELERLRARSRK